MSPTRTDTLYQIVEQYYPAFLEQLAAQERSLPYYVHREFEGYLKCGRLEYGFLRVRYEDCRSERLVACSCKRRGHIIEPGVRAAAPDEWSDVPPYWLKRYCRSYRCVGGF